MKRIAFSLISAALLSAAIVPTAKAAHLNPHHAGVFPEILTPARAASPDVEPSAQQSEPALEQARLNRLSRVGNTNGSLGAYRQQTTSNDHLDPYSPASVSPLQQMRLNHLNNSN